MMLGAFFVGAIAVAPLEEITDANEAFALAEQHFAAEEYDLAADALARAHAIDPRPEFLYARAQAERLGGDCRSAVPLYEQFLRTQPPETHAEDARVNLAKCAGALAAAGEPAEAAPAPAPAPATGPAPADAPPPRPKSSRPWHRDVAGGVLVGTGALTLAVGGGLLGGAHALRERADGANRHSAYDDRITRAIALERAGIALAATGGALTLAGAIRWIVLARRQPRSGRHAALALVWRF
jgi:hypothetical protein